MIYFFKSPDHFKRFQIYLNTHLEKLSFNLLKNYEEDLMKYYFFYFSVVMWDTKVNFLS